MTEKKNLSRRDFLKLAGTSAAAVTAAWMERRGWFGKLE
jgi:hypothetical protein